MKCHICGSEYHLKDHCPMRPSGPSGPVQIGYATEGASSSEITTLARSPSLSVDNHNEVGWSWVVMLRDTDDTQFYLNMSKQDSECLLVDTGAFENLVGSKWVERLENIKNRSKSTSRFTPIHWEQLMHPVPVGGVGNDVMKANFRARVPIALKGGMKTIYDALYLESNNTPALLGTKALQKTNTILDLREGKLHMYCGNTSDIKIDAKGNGYQRMQLVQARSGHILLPCTGYDDE